MIPTVHGLQKVYDRQGIFVGVNIGYNFFAEHNVDASTIVREINKDDSLLYISLAKSHKSQIQISRQLKKVAKEDEKKLRLTMNCPFAGYVVKSSANVYTRTIMVDNTDIMGKYTRFHLLNGKYDLFLMSYGPYFTHYADRFKNRKVMSEDEIFYMPDYNQDLIAMTSSQPLDFAGAWDARGVMILFKHDDDKPDLAEDLADCVKRGYLAMVSGEQRMFKDRGCCLIELDRAYFGKR